MKLGDHNNVILFGAGASADAGIPMLESFIDKMWEYAMRGKVGDKPISKADREILTEANKIRIDLERYNSRAFFDNRNLEDILSLLSFESLAEGNTAKYETMVKAVARTIELSCIHQHNEVPPEKLSQGNYYESFWSALLNPELRFARPALITFNYDLVLERTLWDYFHFAKGTRPESPIKTVGIQYHYGICDFAIRGEPHNYNFGNQINADFRSGEKATFDWKISADVTIPYLKLHGSLNWDQDHPNQPASKEGERIMPNGYPTSAVEKPLILPPVFNKMNSSKINAVWNAALEVLRNAKNIIIVGYSLPKTDIYMQYFLKSAIGPNSGLQKIIVFDPVLFKENEKNSEMRQRYKECFSPQFSSRIIF
jgi:hypothetical protein